MPSAVSTSFKIFENKESISVVERISIDEIRARFEEQGGVGVVSSFTITPKIRCFLEEMFALRTCFSYALLSFTCLPTNLI